MQTNKHWNISQVRRDNHHLTDMIHANLAACKLINIKQILICLSLA